MLPQVRILRFASSVQMRALVLVMISTLSFGSAAHAALDWKAERGLKRFTLGRGETCIIPMNLPWMGLNAATKPLEKASKKELEKLAKAEALCQLDFYNDPKLAICPKSSSTNPGVEIYQLVEDAANISKSTFESATCKKPSADRPGKKLAKLKSTVTCAYTPSMLGYYQLSLALGGAGSVPLANIRTMDRKRHSEIVAMGKKGEIGHMWQSWNGQYSSNSPKSFTTDHEFIYGGWNKNPRGERRFNSVVGAKSGGADGLKQAMTGTQFGNLSNQKRIGSSTARTFTAAAQKIQTLKDFSDMILMDFILSQQDRYGNIHGETRYQYVGTNPKTNKLEVRSADLDEAKTNPELAAAIKAKAALQIDEFILKDNDCGVAKDNLLKIFGQKYHGDENWVIKQIAHMSPKTYKKLRHLNALFAFEPATMKKYFTKELLFSDADYQSVVKNTQTAVAILSTNCKAKKLHLDLDTEEFIDKAYVTAHGKAESEGKCDVVWNGAEHDLDLIDKSAPPQPVVAPKPDPVETKPEGMGGQTDPGNPDGTETTPPPVGGEDE